jgi:hypothetical protein
MRSTFIEPAPDPGLTRFFAPRVPGGRLAGPLRAYRSVASTQAVARAWADADPYVAAGVYSRVDVRPFKPVLP